MQRFVEPRPDCLKRSPNCRGWPLRRLKDFQRKNLLCVMIWYLHYLIGFKPYQMVLQLHPNNLGAGDLQLLVQKSNLIQDQGLDMIAEGLDNLKNMAHDMNEELDRQVPLMDEIDTKVDKATSDLKNTNVRLKDTVNQCVEEVEVVERLLGVTVSSLCYYFID